MALESYILDIDFAATLPSWDGCQIRYAHSFISPRPCSSRGHSDPSPCQIFSALTEKAKWTGIAVVGLLLAIIVFLSFFDWNMSRPALAREITAKTGRPTSIDGDLKVRLWSWNPRAGVNGLSLKNPPWADRDLMFGATRITISVSLGRLLRGQIVLPEGKPLGADDQLGARFQRTCQLGTRHQGGHPESQHQARQVADSAALDYRKRQGARRRSDSQTHFQRLFGGRREGG